VKWDPMAGLVLTEHRGDGRKLAVTVIKEHARARPRWEVIAIESNENAERAEDVFADHGHEVVGRWLDLPTAMRRAERYATAWRMRPTLERCACPEISEP
jgi:hypothetical protein